MRRRNYYRIVSELNRKSITVEDILHIADNKKIDMPRLPDSLEACPVDFLQRFAAYPVHAVDGNSSILYLVQSLHDSLKRPEQTYSGA